MSEHVPLPARLPHLEDVRDYVSVAYRNDLGTCSAIVILGNSGRAVLCEHGKTRAAPDYAQAFVLLHRPTFCPDCVKGRRAHESRTLA